MGGVGKPEIAIEYVHTRRQECDAIFWVESAQQHQLASSFARISRDLGLEDSTAGKTFIASRETLKSWMSMTREQSTVLASFVASGI